MLNLSTQKMMLMPDFKKILITGTAGFIGFHLVTRLLKEKFNIIGIDAVNPYYDISLKYDRLAQHGIDGRDVLHGKPVHSSIHTGYTFYKADLENQAAMEAIFNNEKPDVVINLAAQAGVRYSLSHPREYIKSNIDGFVNIMEGCRYNNVRHLIYASSSSVYGLNTRMPFCTDDAVDHPISLYAATKKSNELMAHTYSYLFGLPTTGLRFFTVYGPWGRPDMALFLFTKAILAGEPIQMFNNGDMIRDFTFVDDIVESIYRLVDKVPVKSDDLTKLENASTSTAPFRVFNIGNSQPIHLGDFVKELESSLGIKAIVENQGMQPGDVRSTYANVQDLIDLIGFKPNTSVKEGIGKFVDWYKKYYKV